MNKKTTNCLTYGELEDLEDKIDKIKYSPDYVPKIEDIEKYLIPDLETSLKMEKEFGKNSNHLAEKLKSESLEYAIVYLEYLISLQKRIKKQQKEAKDKTLHKDLYSYIQKILYDYIKLIDDEELDVLEDDSPGE